ncbi:hypothetical protein QWZ13_15395 [Reinekea marina]|uniref:1-aminocyclopropane-1-carboxylate deaminase/D-cysteine desulfhydrase n=2 Tax=Reinekea marina TaxID=1310421 RepID=A0ABV7WT05_9GAMM|nr:hypothetical protein [Reinekea marina]MDN3650300.1 hypothetical protein [Reinekea marina]
MKKIAVAPLLSSSWFGYRNVKIVRGDLLHPIVSGNKLFKLAPLIERIESQNIHSILSVGGRYSNHLHALAFVAKEYGLPSVGIVQGYPDQELTPTLKDCQRWGMVLHWVNKVEFQKRYEPEFWLKWQEKYPNSEVVLEGGWSESSIKGSQQWWSGIPSDTDLVVTAVGSGTTLAGLALAAPKHVKVVGIPVFQDPDNYSALKQKMIQAGVSQDQYELWSGFAGKKFGKPSLEQAEFSKTFYKDNRIKLDTVYNSKVFHAVQTKLDQDKSLLSQQIAVLHTGGLQGNRK